MSDIKLTLPEFGESSSYTGEAIRIPRLEVPLIRVSYKGEDDTTRVAPKGEFVEYDPATKSTKALGKIITIQILHHRQSLSAYKNEESYYTPEISMKKKTAPLFMASKGKDGKRRQQFLLEGEISKDGELRKSYTDLRYQRSLYVLHDGVLKNLVVYGASFSGFIDFTKSISGQSSASVTVELTTEKKQTGTVIFYPLVFKAKDKVDMKAIEPTLKQLSDWFDEYDRRVEAQQQEKKNQAANDRGDGAAENAHATHINTPAEQPVAATPTDRPSTMAEKVQGLDDVDERAALLAEAEAMLDGGQG